MATLKYRLNRKNASGSYDTIHYETSSNIVMRPSGRSVEQDLTDFLPRTQDTDDVPQSLNKAGIICSNTKVFAGCNSVVELAKSSDIPAQYIHPQEKQCNYEPDLSNYATKEEVEAISGGTWRRIGSVNGVYEQNNRLNLPSNYSALQFKWEIGDGQTTIKTNSTFYGQLHRDGTVNPDDISTTTIYQFMSRYETGIFYVFRFGDSLILYVPSYSWHSSNGSRQTYTSQIILLSDSAMTYIQPTLSEGAFDGCTVTVYGK